MVYQAVSNCILNGYLRKWKSVENSVLKKYIIYYEINHDWKYMLYRYMLQVHANMGVLLLNILQLYEKINVSEMRAVTRAYLSEEW